MNSELGRALHLSRLVTFKTNGYESSGMYSMIRNATRPDYASFDRALTSMANYSTANGDYIRIAEIGAAMVSRVIV